MKNIINMKKMIIITGLGGSGTRMYGQIIKDLGIDLGKNLNVSLDNLDTFAHTGYYKMIKNKFSYDDYDKFKAIFSDQIKNSYGNNKTICIKEPNYHILLHMVNRYCEEEHYELNILHIIRDGLYMMNSKNKGNSRWIYLFPELEDYSDNKNHQYLKYWYLSNLRCFNLLNDLSIKHLVLSYDNYDTNQLQTILDFLDVERNVNDFNISKRENTSQRSDILSVPQELANNVKEINSYLEKN